MIKVTRLNIGYYTVSDGALLVEVIRQKFWDGYGWIAIATWTKDIVTDPEPTKRQTVIFAKEIIETEQKKRACLQN